VIVDLESTVGSGWFLREIGGQWHVHHGRHDAGTVQQHGMIWLGIAVDSTGHPAEQRWENSVVDAALYVATAHRRLMPRR
jgi:hypothetical protein